MAMDHADCILADPLLPLPISTAAAKQQALAGVTDYRGRPVTRGTSGGWRSALFVVGMLLLFSSSIASPIPLPAGSSNRIILAAVEIAGSFAYFGISANLITYLTGPLGQSNASAANAWSGTASLMPLLGAFLADAYLGRYRSIILACSLYVLVCACPQTDQSIKMETQRDCNCNCNCNALSESSVACFCFFFGFNNTNN